MFSVNITSPLPGLSHVRQTHQKLTAAQAARAAHAAAYYQVSGDVISASILGLWDGTNISHTFTAQIGPLLVLYAEAAGGGITLQAS